MTDLYSWTLVLGGVGLAAMGFRNHSLRHSHGHHGHALHGRPALRLLSPRVFFSILLGIGLTGLLAGALLHGLSLFIVACIGGVLFELFFVGRLWDFLLRFASAPAATLEHTLYELATAVTSFDGTGHGIVAVEVDSQLIQLLAELRPDDRRAGLRVRQGDRVRIEEIDARRHRVIVSVP